MCIDSAMRFLGCFTSCCLSVFIRYVFTLHRKYQYLNAYFSSNIYLQINRFPPELIENCHSDVSSDDLSPCRVDLKHFLRKSH